MKYHYTNDTLAYAKYTTEELRSKFLLQNLFQPGHATFNYTDVDRAIVGGLVPTDNSLTLPSEKSMLGAPYFMARRELGVINIGAKGTIVVDGSTYTLESKDSLYIGRGSKDIYFESSDSTNPAKFFITSFPAHQDYPVKLIKKSEAKQIALGDIASCNKRVIFQSIVPSLVDTCQVVMGFTELCTGSNWNTFPPHTHKRRMEVYAYFDLPEDSAVFHLMGKPDETRHIIAREGDAVVSPSWSIHSGVGTTNYSFIWAMGGENQVFDDMDHINICELS